MTTPANRTDPLPDNAPHVLVVDDDHRIRDLRDEPHCITVSPPIGVRADAADFDPTWRFQSLAGHRQQPPAIADAEVRAELHRPLRKWSGLRQRDECNHVRCIGPAKRNARNGNGLARRFTTELTYRIRTQQPEPVRGQLARVAQQRDRIGAAQRREFVERDRRTFPQRGER